MAPLNSSDSDSAFCLPINATESTTLSNCKCFTRVYGYMAISNQTPASQKPNWWRGIPGSLAIATWLFT
ncbi:hypothetical protein N7491_000292 [Penicillium cf. griseofulvum]|uniref:Uncharacterized protein n=1 Tax=Penicillium cf. griseofulvum TaxID=2972120 RepID=A0A9W9MFT8_9EURO|nr:hypothetical protein N7472_004351 [Penicillium cf. griseofulvum]KAJ5441912.1 hypothetical protein N7445_004919 [Penicillium cf. griseofulvum]KAJ5451110.1 hypothetical protein N7491_000292 [Penicillium cf. griseofulvum]